MSCTRRASNITNKIFHHFSITIIYSAFFGDYRSRVSDAEVENIYVEVARDYEEVKKFRNRSDKR